MINIMTFNKVLCSLTHMHVQIILVKYTLVLNSATEC